MWGIGSDDLGLTQSTKAPKGERGVAGGRGANERERKYTAGTAWLLAMRGGIENASGSFGFRGAGNSGPSACFDHTKPKIGDRRENEPIVRAEQGGENEARFPLRRHFNGGSRFWNWITGWFGAIFNDAPLGYPWS